jgi:hypothetical protein
MTGLALIPAYNLHGPFQRKTQQSAKATFKSPKDAVILQGQN